jgi:hypothetical protein
MSTLTAPPVNHGIPAEDRAKPRSEDDPLARDIIARHDQLKGERSTWDNVWQELANFIQPRKNQITQKSTPDSSKNVDLFDTTAVDANMVLGAGQLQYITPAGERWFGYDYPESLKSKDGGVVPGRAAKWFADCTEIAMREVARSNFYTEVHEAYLDRGGMGTACLYAQEGKRTALNFCSHPVGTYSIAEDEEGYVDTVYREFKLTVRQAVQRFGLESMGAKVKAAYNDSKSARLDEKFTFIHAVYPRQDDKRDFRKQDGANKPIASVYVCLDDKVTVRNAGYDEMPYFVTRYLTWGEEVYGYCPSIDILPTIRQVNFIERQMDALAEKAAFPPVLVPSSLDGTIDLRAGGTTVFDENLPASGQPREWATLGRYDVGKDRVEMKQNAIRKAYHNDLFQMFAQADRQMTAYEAMQRVAEKLVMFSPTFARLTTELLNPLLQRIFGILLRAGYFPPPPPEVYVDDGSGRQALAAPQVVYTSKVALAIKALENRSLIEFMQVIGPLIQLRPETMDNLDADKVFTDVMRNYSMPTTWTIDAEVVDQVRAARAQAQAAQQQIANTQAMAKASADASRLPEGLQQQLANAASGGMN